jgi:thymidylate synthase ThyX
MIEAKVIADSINQNGERLTTLQIKVHRYVWSEFMTHRAFSRNAASSRAIPVKTMLKQVWSDPAMPVKWGANKAGMQAGDELQGLKLFVARMLWKMAAKCACMFALGMMSVGLHKQWANRVLEPWLWMVGIVSSTEWDNFFGLRIGPLAQPEMNELAICIHWAMQNSTPKRLAYGEWHLPYVENDRFNNISDILENSKRISAARCARVSYLNHDKSIPKLKDDLDLCCKLTKSKPIHASPFEHQATPMPGRHGNFDGWKQYRQFIEEELSCK